MKIKSIITTILLTLSIGIIPSAFGITVMDMEREHQVRYEELTDCSSLFISMALSSKKENDEYADSALKTGILVLKTASAYAKKYISSMTEAQKTSITEESMKNLNATIDKIKTREEFTAYLKERIISCEAVTLEAANMLDRGPHGSLFQ